MAARAAAKATPEDGGVANLCILMEEIDHPAAAVGADTDVEVGSVTKRFKDVTPSLPSSLQIVIGAIGFYHSGSCKVGGST